MLIVENLKDTFENCSSKCVLYTWEKVEGYISYKPLFIGEIRIIPDKYNYEIALLHDATDDIKQKYNVSFEIYI